MSNIFLVFLSGGAGCVIRYLISRYSLYLFPGKFPVGTLVANFISCIIVGLLVYLYLAKAQPINKTASLLIITGFCGGLSTFSTFSFETFELMKQGFIVSAILNVCFSLLLGIGAIYLIYKSSL